MNRQKKWDNPALLKRLNNILDFAEKETASLLPQQLNAKADAGSVLLQTSTLLAAVHEISAGFSDLRHRIALIALELIPFARNEKLLEITVINESLRGFVYAHIFLTKIGLPDARFDQLANLFLYDSNVTSSNAELEKIWLRKHWSNWEIDGPLVKKILGDTTLGQPVDFLRVTSEYMQAFATELFYAAAFSRTYWLLPCKKAAILDKAEIMLAICIDSGAYQVASALLLAYRRMGQPWNAVTSFAFNVLAAVEETEGVIETAQEQIETTASSLLPPSAFTQGLLYTACLKPGAAPYIKIPASAIRKGTAQRLIQLYDAGESPSSFWVKHFYLLEESEQDALSSFLLNVTLLKSIHQQQYEKVSQLLNLGYVLGIANSIVAIQAAEVLNGLESYL